MAVPGLAISGKAPGRRVSCRGLLGGVAIEHARRVVAGNYFVMLAGYEAVRTSPVVGQLLRRGRLAIMVQAPCSIDERRQRS